MNILDFIPEGRDHAVSRTALATRTGFPDRTVRRLIAHARDEGALIVNNGDGYYLAGKNDLDALERQYRVIRGKSLSMLKWLMASRKILKEAGRLG